MAIDELERRWRWVDLSLVLLLIALLAWFLHTMLCASFAGSPVPQRWHRDLRVEGRADRVSLLFVGDTYFGESYANEARARALAARGYDGPLLPLRDLVRSADLVIGNLEAPLTEVDSVLQRLKNWPHRGVPDASAAALRRAGFAALGLANNHTTDSLGPGLRDTRAALARHDLVSFGAGPSLVEAQRPLRIELGAGPRTVRVAVLGALERQWDDFFSGAFATGTSAGTAPLAAPAIARQIRAMKQADPDLLVIVFPHWGRNYRWRTPRQERIGRALLAAGADLVIGHGAHVFQEVELRDGRAIVYSLGNFVFLSPGRFDEKDIHPWSLAVRLELIPGDDALRAALKLYFIASDNLATDFRPHLLEGESFQRAANQLLTGGSLDTAARDRLRAAASSETDAVGPHLAIDLGPLGAAQATRVP